ncbi:MAG: outer membrane protein transport protein [Comamonadaceae bacterium]|nr:outer membrane protein transport protein [Comamonadaceae bacterium]
MLVAAAFSGYAGAAGFQLWEQNASGLATAYAGSAAVADNASTIFFNPAGMTQLQAARVLGGPGCRATRVSSSPTAGRWPAPGVRLSGSTAATPATGRRFPNGYLSWALTKDLYLGIGHGRAVSGWRRSTTATWVGAVQSREVRDRRR